MSDTGGDPVSYFDTDANGLTDQTGLDVDSNGLNDVWFLDTNENGLVEGVASDSDGNGIADTYAYDLNENGVMDVDEAGRASFVIEGQPFTDTAVVSDDAFPGPDSTTWQPGLDLSGPAPSFDPNVLAGPWVGSPPLTASDPEPWLDSDSDGEPDATDPLLDTDRDGVQDGWDFNTGDHFPEDQYG